MTEEMYTIKKDCYGDYAIFKKDTICIVSDIQDKQLAETLCTQFNLLNDERKGFIEFIQHQNENIEFLEKRINSLKDDRQAYKQDWKAASAYCDSYKEEISYLKDENNELMKENKKLREMYENE